MALEHSRLHTFEGVESTESDTRNHLVLLSCKVSVVIDGETWLAHVEIVSWLLKRT
jgi:hypothetical protein